MDNSSRGGTYGHSQAARSSQEAAPSLWPAFLAGQPGKPVRVVLIDDDAHMRKVISHELLGDLRTDLVAQATSMREGRRLISQHEFDVMLVDLNLGDGNGLDLIDYMKTVHPLAEAVVISAMEDEQHALRAFELGATGYLVKNSWFGNFPQAVRNCKLPRRPCVRKNSHGAGGAAPTASRCRLRGPGKERRGGGR